MTFSSDLCALSTLTESTLLCCVEQRCRVDLTESYVGGVLLSLGSSDKVTGQQFLPSFASSVLRSLAFTHEDQSIVISGYHGSDKNKLSHDLLRALLTHLEQQASPLGSAVLVVSELLDYLSHSDKDNGAGSVLINTLFINPTNLILSAASVSCLLLGTSCISHYKVFHNKNGLNHVEMCLVKLGMQSELIHQVSKVLGVTRDLVAGAKAMQVLGDVGVASFPEDLVSDSGLVQLLYAYTIQWIVCWVNSNCLGAGNQNGCCSISIVHAPGHCFTDLPPADSSTLSAFIPRYTNEVLHNIYCTRLFVWEQEQYLEEGIEWDTVEVEFNESLINCLHQGLLDVLVSLNGDELKARVEKCSRYSNDSCFMLENNRDRFSLVHFTGECEYIVDGKWIETNEVHIASSRLQALLLSSSCGVVVDMAQNMRYSSDVLPNAGKIPCCKLIQRAKTAMDSVCELLTTSRPHFVLCLKPSKTGRRTFNCEVLLNQIQQFKILDVALIQSCGFPVRLEHSIFLKNYNALYVDDKTQVLCDSEKCFRILDKANLKEWHVGKTVVMLKPWHLSQLDAALDLFNQSAKKIQRVFRQSHFRKRNSLPPKHIVENLQGPPSPPPRPSHTLPTPYEAPHVPPSVPGDYDRASSPFNSVNTTKRKKLSWKKPSPSSNSSKSVPTSSNLLDAMWFQGKLSRENAEQRLQQIQFDCFLIRESESRVGGYALSLRHADIIKHFRIDTKHGLNPRYELYGAKRSFPTLEVLVDYYSHHCISSVDELLSVPYSTEKSTAPTPLKRKLSSIRRPKPSLVAVPVTESRLPRTKTTPTLSTNLSLDVSEDSMDMLQRELEVEERIVEAARRMAELPTSNRRERQKRKQSLQMAQSRFLSLRQQFHTLQERKLFIEASMQNAGL